MKVPLILSIILSIAPAVRLGAVPVSTVFATPLPIGLCPEEIAAGDALLWDKRTE